jgi:4'-phosphopantetheinyl transferase
LVGIEPGEVVLSQRCAECGGPHGVPSALGRPGVHVSWSHSHGWVAAIAAEVVVGIDIEAPRPTERTPDARLLGRTATAAETVLIQDAAEPRAAFLRMWVLKESLVKTGRLALKDFGRTDVSGALGPDGSAGEVLGCRVQLHAHPIVTVGTATVLQEDT